MLSSEKISWRKKDRVILVKRLEMELPFAKDLKAAEAWVPKFYFEVELQLLFLFHAANVYVYNIDHEDGEEPGIEKHTVMVKPKWVWKDLHEQPITAIVFAAHPQGNKGGDLIITGSSDTKVKVWKQCQVTKQLLFQRYIGNHTKAVSCIVLHKSSFSVLSAALDGTVQMWSLDSFEPIHRAKLSTAVIDVTLMSQNQFFIRTKQEVKVFRLIHLHETFAQYNSAVVAITDAGDHCVLVQSEDSSARILDTRSAGDLSTMVPAFSTQNLAKAIYSKRLRRLYAILTNGETLVYCMRTNPAKLKETWTTTQKEKVNPKQSQTFKTLNPKTLKTLKPEIIRSPCRPKSRKTHILIGRFLIASPFLIRLPIIPQAEGNMAHR
jgi:WD40 repeat protein